MALHQTAVQVNKTTKKEKNRLNFGPLPVPLKASLKLIINSIGYNGKIKNIIPTDDSFPDLSLKHHIVFD